ncbi:phosphate uptake regulator PhoU [Candidatus Woesearchaeota archaeon]|nr:phosphate uptake regulator PhoU [Candidatus Woesearchaeota archaeon]
MVVIKRSVIQIANSTQLVSLPRKWTKKYNVQKGDELEVEERGNSLAILTESSPSSKEISLNISSLTPKQSERLIARTYQKGYDVIKIKYDNPQSGMSIQNKVKELLGFEIIEKTKDQILIKSISQKLDIGFDSSLRRVFLILIDLAETCLEGFAKNDKIAMESVYDKDFDLNKFCYFCLRSIRKGLHGEFGNYILYFLIDTLEYVGDEYKRLNKNLAKISEKRRKQFISLVSEVNTLVKLDYEFFYNPHKEKLNSAIKIHNDINDLIESMKGAKDENELSALNSLYFISSIVYNQISMRIDALKDLEDG